MYHLHIRSKGQLADHTLQTLTVFLASVLKKKYTNPSSDIITVLAGLDQVDRLMSEFVAVLDGTIRNGTCESSCHVKMGQTMLLCLRVGSVDIRLKAVRTAIAMISGAYRTSLAAYFTHRDLFPSLMKV